MNEENSRVEGLRVKELVASGGSGVEVYGFFLTQRPQSAQRRKKNKIRERGSAQIQLTKQLPNDFFSCDV